MIGTRPQLPFESRSDLPIALIIGAGGLGMAIAQRLGQAHRIVLASLNESEIETGRDRLHELGVISTGFVCDITDSSSVADLASKVVGLGPVRSLAHVAALSPSMNDGPTILRVNLIGPALVERAISPLIVRGGAGLFISSMAGHLIQPSAEIVEMLDAPLEEGLVERLKLVLGADVTPAQAYPFSKLALNRMVRRRAAAWGAQGSRIVSLSPGLIDTPMGATESDEATGNGRNALKGLLPLRRQGTMAEIADASEFLLSSRASYISGTDLLVDGGMAAVLLTQPRR